MPRVSHTDDTLMGLSLPSLTLFLSSPWLPSCCTMTLSFQGPRFLPCFARITWWACSLNYSSPAMWPSPGLEEPFCLFLAPPFWPTSTWVSQLMPPSCIIFPDSFSPCLDFTSDYPVLGVAGPSLISLPAQFLLALVALHTKLILAWALDTDHLECCPTWNGW